jgi:hypothetical protein
MTNNDGCKMRAIAHMVLWQGYQKMYSETFGNTK